MCLPTELVVNVNSKVLVICYIWNWRILEKERNTNVRTATDNKSCGLSGVEVESLARAVVVNGLEVFPCDAKERRVTRGIKNKVVSSAN